jgi:hypothetical protein
MINTIPYTCAVDLKPVEGCEDCEILTHTHGAPTTCRECQEHQIAEACND